MKAKSKKNYALKGSMSKADERRFMMQHFLNKIIKQNTTPTRNVSNRQKQANVKNLHKYIPYKGKKKYVGSHFKPSELYLYQYAPDFSTKTFKRSYTAAGKRVAREADKKGLKIVLKKVKYGKITRRIPYLAAKRG